MVRHFRIGISLIFLSIILLILVLNIYEETMCFGVRPGRLALNIARYEAMRKELLVHERFSYLGGHVDLSVLELHLNRHLMNEKYKEYDQSMTVPCDFKPVQHFYHVFDNVNDSMLLELIQSMPKGGVLYAQDMTLCSTKFLIELSYRENLWICLRKNVTRNCFLGRFEKLLFSLEEPKLERSCKWQLLSDLRQVEGAEKIDKELSDCLTLHPIQKFFGSNEVWHSMKGLISFLYGLLTYAPVWKDYFHRALLEFYEDGVQYLEFRSTLPILYDLNKHNYTQLDTARIIKEVNKEFLCSHPDYIGTKIIYAPSRNVTDKEFDDYVETTLSIKNTYPELIAGFDLTPTYTAADRPLQDLSYKLLAMRENIDLYLHFGDSVLYNIPTDEDLVDAILLGSKRIGHTFGLLRHPDVLHHVALNDIGIEMNPISNQAMQQISDYQQHPGSYFLANNFPVVIASNIPTFWKSTPLSHDFYVTFFGIASRSADLGLLKKLAWNSLKYSAMTCEEKEQAFTKFMQKWYEWVDQKINEGL